MLNLRRLEVLRAVARHGSFSSAADELAYTQSAVSQSIARLEAETGVVLLHRGRRGVTPTSAGERLIAHAETILGAVRAAEDDLAASTGVERRRLRIAAFPSGGATLMPPAVARFRRTHPEVSLTLTEGEPEELIPRLRAGELDLALLFDFPPPAGRPRRAPTGLRARPLLEDPLELVLPAEHPLRDRAEIALTDLRGEAWVQPSSASPCAHHVVGLCRAAGFDPDVAFESDEYGTVLGLVAAGVGVALVPRLAIPLPPPGVVVRELSPASPARRVTVASSATVPLSPAARAMTEVLSEVVRRQAAQPREPR